MIDRTTIRPLKGKEKIMYEIVLKEYKNKKMFDNEETGW